MRRPRRRWIRWGILGCLLVALGFGIKYGRHHVFPKRFAVVEAGLVYRSGYCQPGPLRRVLEENDIRTILTLLNDEPDTQEQQQEEAIARTAGVHLVRIGMPGDGLADFDLLNQAADVIADPANRPLLVHCYAGVNRTGASLAAWRMKHLGWTPEQALAEAAENGLTERTNPRLLEHLRRFEREYLRAAPTTHPQVHRRPARSLFIKDKLDAHHVALARVHAVADHRLAVEGGFRQMQRHVDEGAELKRAVAAHAHTGFTEVPAIEEKWLRIRLVGGANLHLAWERPPRAAPTLMADERFELPSGQP
ncbi:MAG: hypothetical protein AMXMBFR13_31460 [Phycisphaerae bacterium]